MDIGVMLFPTDRSIGPVELARAVEERGLHSLYFPEHTHIPVGRFVFGIGVGWNEDEMAHHGVDPARRRAVAREHVLAMKALWTQDEAAFEGDHVHLEPSWSWPKPVQRPHPPILLGGAGGPVTFRHVVEYCDGFMPIGGRGVVRDRVTELRQVATEAGRDPDSLLLKVFGVRPKPETLQDHAQAGVGEVIVGLPSADADVVLPLLDRCASLVGAV